MEFFTGTVLLILFLAAMIAVVGMWVSYEESLFWAAVTWVVSIAVLHFAFGISLLSVLGVWGAIGTLLAYILLGGMYTAFILWPRWLKSKEEEIKTSAALWRKDQTVPNFYDSVYYREFSAFRHKEKLAAWTMMWVFNLIWDVTHKPLIWVYEKAYRSFDSVDRKTISRIIEK